MVVSTSLKLNMVSQRPTIVEKAIHTAKNKKQKALKSLALTNIPNERPSQKDAITNFAPADANVTNKLIVVRIIQGRWKFDGIVISKLQMSNIHTHKSKTNNATVILKRWK